MAAYLKLEESTEEEHVSLRNDLMGLSLLALLLSPWTALGLLLSMFNMPLITPALTLACALALLTSIPKALQLLLPEPSSCKQKLN